MEWWCVFLTIILRVCVGYEMIDSQRGATARSAKLAKSSHIQQARVE